MREPPVYLTLASVLNLSKNQAELLGFRFQDGIV